MYAEVATYSGLEAGNLLIGKSVRLGNDGDKVDLGVKSAHDLDVKGLEGVASRLDEEDTSVNSVVNDVHAVDLVLGIEVGVEALLNVVGNGAPRLVVVDKVAEARSVNNGQAETNTSLFDIGADGLDGDGLGDDVEARTLALLGGVQGGVEEGVNKRGLAKTRFTCRVVLERLSGNAIHLNIPTTMTLKLNPLRTLLRCHWLGRLANPT